MDNSYHGLSQGGAVPSALHPDQQYQQSAFGVAEVAMEETIVLCHRVLAIVDRLCGPVPTSGTGIGKDQLSSSVFDALRTKGSLTASYVQEAVGALNRLERELP